MLTPFQYLPMFIIITAPSPRGLCVFPILFAEQIHISTLGSMLISSALLIQSHGSPMECELPPEGSGDSSPQICHCSTSHAVGWKQGFDLPSAVFHNKALLLCLVPPQGYQYTVFPRLTAWNRLPLSEIPRGNSGCPSGFTSSAKA